MMRVGVIKREALDLGPVVCAPWRELKGYDPTVALPGGKARQARVHFDFRSGATRPRSSRYNLSGSNAESRQMTLLKE